jgi:thioredoxin-like negative regulator of GroEL
MLSALSDDRDEARAAMVDAFAALGDDDPLTAEYRRKLASALF